MTLSMAYSKSCSVTARPLCLAACRAASLTMLAMSAPGGEGGREKREWDEGGGQIPLVQSLTNPKEQIFIFGGKKCWS